MITATYMDNEGFPSSISVGNLYIDNKKLLQIF